MCAFMDTNSFSWVDTSLNLNAKPLLQRFETTAAPTFIQSRTDPSVKREISDALEEEVDRARAENRKLTEMLTAMCESYNALRRQFLDCLNSNPCATPSSSKKRKTESSDHNNDEDAENNNNNQNLGTFNIGVSESSTTEEESTKKLVTEESSIKAKISTVCVRTRVSSNSLVAKDGYHWRKYGQKVTRDNPCPRAYYKCSFAPSCPVKKKVQLSPEDQSVVVATYEGEHNHPPPSPMEPNSSSPSGRCITIGSAPALTLDLTRSSKTIIDVEGKRPRVDSPEVRQSLVEQMASTLTKDPSFSAALAAAVSGKMFSTK